MRRITLIFALLLSLMGVRQANAETLTANFNSGLPEGWSLVGDISNSDDRARSGKGLWTSSKSTTDNYVITEAVEGTFEFYARAYNKSYASTVDIYEYTGSGLGTKLYSTPSMYSSSTPTWSKYSFTVEEGTQLAIVLNYAAIDDVTYTQNEQAEGPALKVTGDDNGILNFGMVNPNATKDLTLSNPGTQDITVDITTTGGFTTDASKTIAAGTKETLSIAAPNKTATGKVTITPTVTTVAAVTINLSCTVKDPAKVYEYGFTALPEDWTTTGYWYYSEANGAYTTSWYLSSNARLITPLLVISEGESFLVEAKGYSTSYTSYQHLQMQYSADGTTWTNFDAEPTLDPTSWNTYTFTGVPAGTYYIAINASQADIRMFYGGELDQTPRPKLEVEGIANGGSLSWGYSDVPAGDTKTITLKNDGTADLNVTIAATNDYTVDPASATVAAGGTVEVTIGTPAHDGPGVLTITPAEESGLSPYTISLSSYYKEPKPAMSIDKTSVAFGKVNAVTSETITVSNTGDADLVVSIENDNAENFTVAPAESLTVAPGETGEITITYNFVEGTWGTFNANVKLTPNYGGTYDVKTIAVSATSKDPNSWDEDFEEGAIPANWIADGWTVSTPGSYSGGNGTKMAGGNSKTATLITPRLVATEGQELTFELGGSDSSYPLTVEYSTDRETWETVATFTENGTQTIAAPTTTSNFYLRFTGWVYIDNLAGFKLDLPAHDAVITATTIPATGSQFAEYTASVTVKEQAGKSEELTAKFFIGETQYGEDVVETVNANGTKTFTVTFTPEEAISGDAYFTVTNADINLTSEKKAIEIAAAPVLDETAASEITTGTVDALVLKYTPKAGWNTICVPFALTEDILNQIFGEGWKAYEYKGYSNGEFTFSKATFFAAGYPYLVFAQDAQAAADGFKIENVNITAATENSDSYGGATFKGTYAPMAAGTMEGKYGVVPNAEDIPSIKKGGANATLKGYRGYFEIPAGGGVKGFSFTLVDDATGISQFVATPENGAIYDLNGNKVKNLVKGQVYIMNGQKILVK